MSGDSTVTAKMRSPEDLELVIVRLRRAFDDLERLAEIARAQQRQVLGQVALPRVAVREQLARAGEAQHHVPGDRALGVGRLDHAEDALALLLPGADDEHRRA